MSTGILLVAGPGNEADIRYACGFKPVDPVVFLDAGARSFLAVPMLEVGRARIEAPRANALTPAELGLDPADRRSIGAWARGLLRHANVRRVRVNGFFPLGVARLLEADGVRMEVTDEPLYPARAIKRPDEVEAIARVQRAAVAAMKEALRAIRAARVGRNGELRLDGRALSSESVKTLIARTLLAHGCHASDPIVACGRHAADPHHRGEGPLWAGQPIVLDIFPRDADTGYWGDITRTVVKGKASPEVARMHRSVRAAHGWALAAARPGARADRIHREIQRRLAADGFATETRGGTPVGFFHGTGHGVGLDIHESPAISTAPVRLRRGHVVTIEPGLYYPEWGGIRIEDTVVMESGGARLLCPCPYPFELP